MHSAASEGKKKKLNLIYWKYSKISLNTDFESALLLCYFEDSACAGYTSGTSHTLTRVAMEGFDVTRRLQMCVF